MTSRIVLVVPEYPPHSVGGGGIAYRSLAHGLQRLGNDVQIFSGDYTGATGTGNDGGIVVRRFGLLPFPRAYPFLSGYMPPYPTRALHDALASVSATAIVHVHGIFAGFCDMVALSRARGMKPYFLTNHGYPRRPFEMRPPVPQAFAMYERTVVTRVVQAARRVSAISSYCAQDGPLHSRTVDIIENGIDVETGFRADVHRAANRLVFVGRLQKDKGLHVLLRALANAPEWDLRIVGPDAGELQNLKGLSESLHLTRRVAFAGAMDRSDALREMSSAYAVIMPSLNEPFGLVGLEAMMCGALLVCSDAGGHRSYASDENAVLFATGSADALAATLTRLPLPPSEYAAMRKAALETAQSRSWRSVAERYCAWYSEGAAA